MKRLLPITLALALAAVPLQAEEDGMSIMERGAQLFFEGLMKEMEPAIEEFSGLADQIGPAMRDFAEQMGPKLSDLLDEVKDWSVYEAPEILPNGDIIIRRKPDQQQPEEEVQKEPAPQIEL